MIKITVPTACQAEASYVFSILFSDILKIPFSIQLNEESTSDYKITIDSQHQIIIKNAFFSMFSSSGKVLLFESHIPVDFESSVSIFGQARDLPILYGNSNTNFKANSVYIGIDIVGCSYFMLTRWEETITTKRDSVGRFSGKNSLAFRKGFIHRPIVNEYARLLLDVLNELTNNSFPFKSDFTLIPTHDVDRVYFQPMLALASAAFKLRSSSAFWKRLKIIFNRENPRDSFDFLMQVSEKYGLKSEFNFISGKPSKGDPLKRYNLRDKFILSLCSKIKQRGHKFGFHPSFASYDRPDEWTREKKVLEDFLQQPIKTGRQHYLRVGVPMTWQIWNSNNMDVDSSFGYHDIVGFRCGTGHTFPVFDWIKREKLKLKEQPLILMEGALVESEKIMVEDARQKAFTLVDQAKKWGTPMSILFHNSSFFDVPWEGWDQLYLELFRYAYQT